MKLRAIIYLLCVSTVLFFSAPVTEAFAQEATATLDEASTSTTTAAVEAALLTQEEVELVFDVGTVTKIVEEQSLEVDGIEKYIQRLQVENKRTGEVSEITMGNEFQPLLDEQRFSVGDAIVLTTQQDFEGNEFTVLVDVFRLPILFFLAAVFVVLVSLVGGVRGVLSIGGMLGTFLILGWYLLPELLAGANPVFVSSVAAVVAGAVTIYLAHGFHRKSHIALGAIIAVLLVVAVLSSFTVTAARLFGLGDEQAYFLQFAEYGSINLQGLFLAGIIIGALGVLDDIVVAQVSVVEQLLGANKKMTKQELYFRALEVGKDHVASLVNTLVLAYAGTSLPLFLLVFADTGMPLWVKINDQVIAEEVVRTLSGSIGLVLAVPLTTLLAVYLLDAEKVRKATSKGTLHVH